jgi:lysozyme family protein
MSEFDHAFALIIAAEGNYSNDVNDPGGKTRYGITEAVARANGYQGDMKELPLDKAKAIYKSEYWDKCKCDQIKWPLSAYVFDSAVNQGVQPAIKMLQNALGTVQDGILGPQSISLAQRAGKYQQARFMALRAQRYVGTRNFDRFGNGWLTRIFTLAIEA